METDEKNIAICYLRKEGNAQYTCELTDRRLIIRRKRNLNEFLLTGLRSVEINHRKLLVPIVASGIFTPLTAVGFFEGLFHPVVAVIFILTGIFAFHIGWTGHFVLTVQENQGHADFPLKYPGENLKAFVEFSNQYIEKVPFELRSLYLPCPEGTNEVNMIVPPVVLYTYRQMKSWLLSAGKIPEKIWVIDPLKAGAEIRYERLAGSTELRPVLKGKVGTGAVIGKYTRDEFMAITPENKIY